MQCVACVPAHTELRHVGSPDGNSPGRSQFGNMRGIPLREGVPKRNEAVRGGRSLNIDAFLHRDGNATQRPGRATRVQYPVGSIRRRKRLVGQ